eukprot:jgi/Picsp_1/6102/NSC_03456-R1_zinc finger
MEGFHGQKSDSKTKVKTEGLKLNPTASEFCPETCPRARVENSGEVAGPSSVSASREECQHDYRSNIKKKYTRRRGGRDNTSKKQEYNGGKALAQGRKKVSWGEMDGKTKRQTGHQGPPCDEEAPMCLLCCEEVKIVSFGACNHMAACGKCCLRLRMCYSKFECVVCKKNLDNIVLAPWKKDMLDFEYYNSHPKASSRIHMQLGPGQVMVAKNSGRLLQELLTMVSLSCAICDSSSFNKPRSLIDHMKRDHGKFMCNICLNERRVFPRDLDAYSSIQELRQHKKDSHPKCRFCGDSQFYDKDELWNHLIQNHFRCQLCDDDDDRGSQQVWFRNAAELQLHLSNEHFACETEECRACLVAFRSLDQLQRHHMEYHSGRMRRWDASQSRQLQVDFNFTRGSSRNSSNSRRFPREMQGGLTVIDDDVGMLSLDERQQEPGLISHTGQSVSNMEEHYPSLGEVNRVQAPPTTSAPRLVSRSSRCPCGRRKRNFVVQEGEEVPSVECDGLCRLEGRRNQLDDAFGIDRESHFSVFERKKASWSGELLMAAKHKPDFIKEIEGVLEAFLRGSVSRKQLHSMRKEKRAIVHGMSEQYGVASSSLGNEPNRCVHLFKPTGVGSQAGLPDRLLSSVALTVSDDDIDLLLKQEKKYPLEFIDITPIVDLHYYLRQWNGHYNIDWSTEDSSTAIVSFDDQGCRDEVINQLGGGIRGLFRIMRIPDTSTDQSIQKPETKKAPWASAGTSAGSIHVKHPSLTD